MFKILLVGHEPTHPDPEDSYIINKQMCVGFVFVCLYACVSLCVCTHVSTYMCRHQKRTLDFSRAKAIGYYCESPDVLQTKLGPSSGAAAEDLNH